MCALGEQIPDRVSRVYHQRLRYQEHNFHGENRAEMRKHIASAKLARTDMRLWNILAAFWVTSRILRKSMRDDVLLLVSLRHFSLTTREIGVLKLHKRYTKNREPRKHVGPAL